LGEAVFATKMDPKPPKFEDSSVGAALGEKLPTDQSGKIAAFSLFGEGGKKGKLKGKASTPVLKRERSVGVEGLEGATAR